MMRSTLAPAAIALALLMGGAEAADKMVIVTGVDPGFSIFYVAKQNNLGEKHGLELDLKTGPTGGASIPLLIGNQSNASMSAVLAGVNNHLVSNDVCAVAQVTALDRWFAVVAKKEFGKFEDLKGKKIGVTMGTSAESFWNAILEQKKLDRAEWGKSIVKVEPPEMTAALERGDIDAFITWEPWISRTVMAVKNTYAMLDNKGIFKDIVFVYMNRKWVAENPETARKFMRTMIDSNTSITTKTDDARQVVGKFLNLSPELMGEMYPKLTFVMKLDQESYDYTKQIVEQLKSTGRIKEPGQFDYNKFFCPDLLKSVAADRVKLPATM